MLRMPIMLRIARMPRITRITRTPRITRITSTPNIPRIPKISRIPSTLITPSPPSHPSPPSAPSPLPYQCPGVGAGVEPPAFFFFFSIMLSGNSCTRHPSSKAFLRLLSLFTLVCGRKSTCVPTTFLEALKSSALRAGLVLMPMRNEPRPSRRTTFEFCNCSFITSISSAITARMSAFFKVQFCCMMLAIVAVSTVSMAMARAYH